jgi:hypothetical protein
MAGTTPQITPRMRMRIRKLVDGFDNLTLKNQLWLIENAPEEDEDDFAVLNGSASHAQRDTNGPDPGSSIPPPPRPAPHEGGDVRNLVVALELAGADIPVFPARLDWNSESKKWDKSPAINGWQQAATTDLERIRAWYRDLPRALGVPGNRFVSGIWCGHPDSNFVVVDADRHGGPDGVAEFDALVAQHGLPNGPVVATAGGGFHYIFRQPDGEPLGNRSGALPRGVDVRGRGGWIVAPGSTRPDGAIWHTADGSLPLIEALRNNSIPTLPTWIADLIRTKPLKAPKEKAEATKAASSDAAPSSSKRMTLRGEKYAAKALDELATELADVQPGSRNNRANELAFRLATMAARGWIDRETVFGALFKACEHNGLVGDDGEDSVLRTLNSGFDDGLLKPHPDLPDRLKQPRQRSSTDHDDMQFLRFRSEVRALFRMRFPYETDKAVEEADARIAEITSANRHQRGKKLQATFEECKQLRRSKLGRRRAGFPSTFLPYDVSDDVVREWLKAEKRVSDKVAQQKRRLDKKANQAAVNALDDRAIAVLTFLRNAKAPQSTAQIIDGVRRSVAFSKVKGRPLRNAVLRVLAKLDDLTIKTRGVARNGKPTNFVEARRDAV